MKCVWLILTLCAAANCQAPAQAPAQSAAQPAPKGSLSGQVVNGKTGAPLKKASVRLSFINQGNGPGRGAPGPQSAQQQVDVAQIQMQVNAALAQAGLPVSPVNMSGMPQGPSIRTVETDESGRFVFTGLAGGKYRLSAERQGFLRQSYGERKYSGGGTPVVVGDGQNVTNLLFRMNPQGVITGKVLDEDGEPMATCRCARIAICMWAANGSGCRSRPTPAPISASTACPISSRGATWFRPTRGTSAAST